MIWISSIVWCVELCYLNRLLLKSIYGATTIRWWCGRWWDVYVSLRCGLPSDIMIEYLIMHSSMSASMIVELHVVNEWKVTASCRDGRSANTSCPWIFMAAGVSQTSVYQHMFVDVVSNVLDNLRPSGRLDVLYRGVFFIVEFTCPITEF
jgi:hypothetical protein